MTQPPPAVTSVSKGPTSYRTQARPTGVAPQLSADRFTAVYEAEVGTVYRFFAARVRTREEAEDLTSDTFQRAWRNWASYRADSSPRAWLFGIARRALVDQIRRRPPLTLVPVENAVLVADGAAGPEAHAVYHERQLEAAALLAMLLPEQQDVLCLRFIAELSYAEIGKVVGKREDAVKKIAYRAIQELQRRQQQ